MTHSDQIVKRAPVPTWYLLVVRELMEAGNQLAELLEYPTTEAEAAGAAARWETALMAAGRAS